MKVESKHLSSDGSAFNKQFWEELVNNYKTIEITKENYTLVLNRYFNDDKNDCVFFGVLPNSFIAYAKTESHIRVKGIGYAVLNKNGLFINSGLVNNSKYRLKALELNLIE